VTLMTWKTSSMAIVAAALFTTASLATEQTYTGRISDSACGRKHEEAAEGQGKMADRECTEACVRGGSLYVFVSDEKDRAIYHIANQKHADVVAHAGDHVKLTGELKDKTLTVSKVEVIPNPDE